MISRIWHGWTSLENADAYERLLRTEIFEAIGARSIDGFLGIVCCDVSIPTRSNSSPSCGSHRSKQSAHLRGPTMKPQWYRRPPVRYSTDSTRDQLIMMSEKDALRNGPRS
jgi:hypothetical protein